MPWISPYLPFSSAGPRLCRGSSSRPPAICWSAAMPRIRPCRTTALPRLRTSTAHVRRPPSADRSRQSLGQADRRWPVPDRPSIRSVGSTEQGVGLLIRAAHLAPKTSAFLGIPWVGSFDPKHGIRNSRGRATRCPCGPTGTGCDLTTAHAPKPTKKPPAIAEGFLRCGCGLRCPGCP